MPRAVPKPVRRKRKMVPLQPITLLDEDGGPSEAFQLFVNAMVGGLIPPPPKPTE